MAKIGLPKGSGKWLKIREKSVKSQGILKWILSGNPAQVICTVFSTPIPNSLSLLIFDNALNCSETHLPVHQSIQLIYQR